MKLIKRELYLQALFNVEQTIDIKVITGIRRSGKSKLLNAFKEELCKRANVNVIHINFGSDKFKNIKNGDDLLNYVKSKFEKEYINYLLIDEVQMCDGFEKTLNYLHDSEKYRIYVTGSNAFLQSSDLTTLFSGRVFPISIFPFSFQEFSIYYKDRETRDLFYDYIFEGGMSGSYIYKTIDEKYEYLENGVEGLIIRDIITKYKIENINLLNKIIYFLFDNISNPTSSRKIANVLTNNNNITNHKTVSKYIKYLCNAYLFYPIKRFDLVGKKYLTTNEKYYLADHAFKYARLGTRNINRGRSEENIVLLELLRRKYKVYAGILYKNEIDFVAMNSKETLFIQVADTIEEQSTLERETRPLLSLKNGYKKILIANTHQPMYTYEGIEVIDIRDWLLNK